jgi:predicted hotdog family 3-hydroxylacyl-ACP dehydratase
MSRFDRPQIMRMIPHSGAMCLLDEVLEWNKTSLRCRSRRYRDLDNPMRRGDGTLGMISGIEIAGQAVAVHGRLLAASTGEPAQGYLVSLREVQACAGRLDAIAGDLLIDAELLAGDGRSATYHFALSVAGTALLDGRLTVLLQTEPEPPEPK